VGVSGGGLVARVFVVFVVMVVVVVVVVMATMVMIEKHKRSASVS
jgi:hypothetical protein